MNKGKVAIAVGLSTFLGVWLSSFFHKNDPDPELPPVPPNPEPIEDYAKQDITKAGQCDPVERPGVIAFRQYIIGKYGEHPKAARNIVADCSIERSTGSPSEHWEGRAWDWMILDKFTAQQVIEELHANDNELIKRAGIMYMLYDHKMWRAYEHGNETRTWAPYTGPNPHTDHIHFSFSWPGARAETSFYRNLPIA